MLFSSIIVKLYYKDFDYDGISLFVSIMKIVSKTKKQILEEIKNNPTYGYTLAKKLDLPISFIYEHLRELREAGLINYVEKDRKKIYQLTEKGTLLLKVIE